MSRSGASRQPGAGSPPRHAAAADTCASSAIWVLLLLAARSLVRRLAWALSPADDALAGALPPGHASHTLVDGERRQLEDIFRFGTDILQKKYELYMWCETKTYNLLTANGALLAAIFLLLNSLGDFNERPAVWFLGLLSSVLVLASVVVSLVNIIPRMDSGATSRKNLRSVIGTNNFDHYDDYHDALSTMDLKAMVYSNSEQIYGMNKNVWKSQSAIRRAAWFTAAGVVALAMFAVLASTTKPSAATGQTPATSAESTTTIPSISPTSQNVPSTLAGQTTPETMPTTNPPQGSQ